MGRIVISTLIILAAFTAAWAQDLGAVEQQTEGLRAQLRDVADKEAQLRERVRQLEEDLSPQNVERSVSTIGTTDAGALRDQRRQQLERQKAGVEEQLTSLAASRGRLESAIATAEAEAVRLRAAALGASNAPPRAEPRTETATAPARPAAPAAARKKQPARRTIRRVKRVRPRGRVKSQ